MKKNYLQPSMKFVQMGTTEMMAGSTDPYTLHDNGSGGMSVTPDPEPYDGEFS